MLTLNRNRQNLNAPTIPNRRTVLFRSMALAVFCGMASTAPLALGQGSDSGYRNPSFDQAPSYQPPARQAPSYQPPSREPSILVHDERPAQATVPSNQLGVIQPLRPQISSPPATSSLQPQVSSAGFEIPRNPTREDFTNPNTDNNVIRASLSDGSSAVGTYAHESQEPADQFAEPQPPSAPIRSFGGTSSPDRFAQPPQPDHEPSPIAHNDLRSSNTALGSNTTPSSYGATTNEFGPRVEPKVDSITASQRFVDTRPAPPAAMPDTSTERFNPQLFSPNQTPASPAVRAQPVRPFASEPNPTVDHQVAATSFAQTIVDRPVGRRNSAGGENLTGSKDLAQQIVDRYSMDNAPQPLPGEPTTLTEMLQQPIPQQHRPAMVNQYWETWFDWASMQNAIAYQEWLATVPSASAQGEQGLLDAAKSAAENQVLAAKIQLGKSQAKLVRFMPTRRSNIVPLPSDSPLVERYETHYEIYKARNLLPAKLIGIDQMLPQTLTLINNRAATVQKSQAAIKQNQDGYSRKRVPLASVLEAARVWRSAEQDLLASVTSYNQAITDYAFNITRRHTTPEQTVAMLIGTPKAKSNSTSNVSRTAGSSFGNRNGGPNNGSPNNGSQSRNLTAASFGQPASDRNAATQDNVAQSSTDSTVGPNETLAPTNRPPWTGGTSNNSRPSVASSSGRPGIGRSTADGRPSLGTTSRGSFGGASSRSGATSSPPASSASFGTPSTRPGSQPPARSNPPTRSFNGGSGFGGSGFGSRSSSTGSNALGTSGNAAASSATSATSAASTTPAAPAKPKRKPFPLPKRRDPSNNGFGGF